MWGGDSGQGEQDDRKPSSTPMVLVTNESAGGGFDVPRNVDRWTGSRLLCLNY